MNKYSYSKDGINFNLNKTNLIEISLLRCETKLANNGAVCAETGIRSGRSPDDRFIVYDQFTQWEIDWGEFNKPFDIKYFEALWLRLGNYLNNRESFISLLHVCADPIHYQPIRIIAESSWHMLFSKIMFISPKKFNPVNKQEWIIFIAPLFNCIPIRDNTNSEYTTIIDFKKKRILIIMHYAGEIKKSMFSVLNFILPEQGILPMHCSANVGEDKNTTLFFGLSGTGKTTLSSDPNRYLIGDDEHGWKNGSVFNYEGGCYAKTSNISINNDPVIWNAIKFGTLLENVFIDENSIPDYDNMTISSNSRAAYPLEFIKNRVFYNYANEPIAIVFLTCDMTGIIPMVSLLSKEAAAYHFISGYTAKIGSTEISANSNLILESTFSTCFGAPFFPRAYDIYAKLLINRISLFKTNVYIVNTGWTGGFYGGKLGNRINISITRQIINAIQQGKLINTKNNYIPGLNLFIPIYLECINSKFINPRNTWRNKKLYDKKAKKLILKFINNFSKFQNIDKSIINAGPYIL
ncbi:Phosphoenolpyruvate carboxykinase [ATP] [Candidatus Johnevansia muelleri]|uniref:Phosphoenolpyruvate carboxykinase (ATP) n=1 Tax=Candidatus Johnevansia muelleri TaxID=1495769 RepID=A0A078KHM7_9GAMM|nr:Phosphoenolpyruvate carboxykinase [ATP] [Candidatus Evansia muelleri]